MARVAITQILAVITRLLSKSGQVDYLCPADCGRREFEADVLEMLLYLLNWVQTQAVSGSEEILYPIGLCVKLQNVFGNSLIPNLGIYSLIDS